MYACKILLRCDSFEILNFAIKQAVRRCAKEKVHARENIPLRFWSDLCCVKKKGPLLPSVLSTLVVWLNMYTTRHLRAVMTYVRFASNILTSTFWTATNAAPKPGIPGPPDLIISLE